MKKLIVWALLAYAGWHYYQNNLIPDQPEPYIAPPAPAPVVQQVTHFSCDGRLHCSQMTSRAEAEFFNSNCPHTKMDGDHDGIPCENDSRF